MNIICPFCDSENIEGEDRCSQCLASLMQTDLPEPEKDDDLQSTIMTAPVAELLTGKDLLVANKSDSISKIVKVLERTKKDCVLIYENKQLVGIVSLRDLLRKAPESSLDLDKASIETVMTSNPETIKPEDPIAFLVNKMSMGGFRHVPVLATDGTPLSIVSIKDVLGYLSDHAKASPSG